MSLIFFLAFNSFTLKIVIVNTIVTSFRLVLHKDELLNDGETVLQVVMALQRCSLLVQAGEVFQATGKIEKALEMYRKGHAYAKAIELARRSFPGQVTELEESWADYLMSSHKPEQVPAFTIAFID